MRTQLYAHNKIAYQKVMKAFETSDRTCIVHPTGTGKSYLIAAVSESYKKVLILGPNIFVLDQVHDVLRWRRQGVEYMTYQTLMLTDSPHTDYDLICLDEFHRAGALEWGAAVDRLLEMNTEAKVFGTTATHIRYLDGERNMADELFHGNIASYITIAEAWNRNILPIPRYVSGLFRWDKTVGDTKERISKSRRLTQQEKRNRIFRLTNAHLHWELSYGMPAILRKHLDRDARRVIVFCGNIEGLEQMREEVVGWFREAGFTIAGTFLMHSLLPDGEQRSQMRQFESDSGEGLRLMLSVNMLNEGIHVPNVNAVLMLRTTSSRIIYMQQMGRCLTTANTAKPLVLDMVDNITTTTAIKDLQDDFDAIEIPQAEREGREPRRFEVKDYTLGVRQMIDKLVPEAYTADDRLRFVGAFAEKHGRLPKPNEKDDYRHWAWLVRFQRNDPRVQELIKRFHYRTCATLDDIKERIRAFATENDRWPGGSKTASKKEQSLRQHFYANRDELLQDEAFRQLYEYYRDKDKLTFEKRYAIVLSYCQQYDRLPTLPRKKEFRENVTGEERQAANCWKWLRDRYPGDERIMAVTRGYRRTCLREEEVRRRVTLLTDFITEKHRQPNTCYPEEVKLATYINSLRNQPYCEREDVKNLLLLVESVKAIVEDADKLLDEYIQFCEANHKIPSRHSKDSYEVSLYKRTICRKSIKENPRYMAVREKYKKQRMSQDEERHIVMEHCRQTGRRPSKKTCSAEVFRAWSNIKRTDKDFSREIQEKYPQAIVWSNEDTECYAEQMISFVKEHNRRPNIRLDGHRLYNILCTLLRHKGDHPSVVRLKEVLAGLPPSVIHHKYYNTRQRSLRSHADRYGYTTVKDRGGDPATRYVIFYTPETRRNQYYEQKCAEAGLEIRMEEIQNGKEK